MTAVERTTFRTSRLIEFCSEKELVTQTGHDPEDWPLVVLKELVDNALDACEEAGVAPVIRVVVAGGKIRVRDNGPGLPPETVNSILDFSTRTSSREAYVAPDRGAQGNALKTILAMPFALSGTEGRVEIVSRGVRRRILFRVDQVRQEPVIDLTAEQAPVRIGTSVTVDWPATSRSELQEARAQFLQLGWEFGILNPHADLRVYWRLNDGYRLKCPATRTGCAKWTPSAPTSAHWYRRESAERLAAAFIAHDRERGRMRSVSEFVANFAGLTGTAKRKAVVDAVGLARKPLDVLVDGNDFDHPLVDRLLGAMQSASRPIKPSALGAIGRDHLDIHLIAMGGDPDSLQYKRTSGCADGRPWCIEVAFAYRPEIEERLVMTGVNWSPAIDMPIRDLWGWLAQNYCGRSDAPVIFFAHLAMPRPAFTDRGKSSLALGPAVEVALREATFAVTKRWRKQCEAEIRDRNRAARRRDALGRHRRISIKEAVWEVLPAAYRKASSDGQFPALARQIYYAARPTILELTGKDTLDAAYFSYTLLPQFREENPELTRGWRVLFKPRGNLTEPHTRLAVPLGTAEVAGYRKGWTNGEFTFTDSIAEWAPGTRGPHNRYAALLIAEKEGIADLLLQVGLAERFDASIVGNEGQSVTAELALADALGLPIFVLHDFDRAGLVICENLRSGTWRHRYRNRFPVVDIGLRLHQVGGLEDEPISDKNFRSVSNSRLIECGAGIAELDFLRKRRVELNALTTEQLVTLVEDALAEHGVEKVIPSDEELSAAWRAARAHQDVAEAVEEAAEEAERWRDAPVPRDLGRRVRAMLKEDPRTSWDAALRRIVRGGAK